MSSSWAFTSLDEEAREACIARARLLFSSWRTEPLRPELQGGCSFTLGLFSSNVDEGDRRPQRLLQFRPVQYALSTSVLDDAKAIYGPYAPSTRFLGSINLGEGPLELYIIDLIHGTPYTSLIVGSEHLDASKFSLQLRYLTGLADFLARGWQHSMEYQPQRKCTGKVGRCVRHKIRRLSKDLPSYFLRKTANWVYDRLHLLDRLPVVLCHGDLIPSNVLIDESTSSISGFIDWAEAEYLPFGTPLYALEHFLGYTTNCSTLNRFTYYSCAQALRRHFWKKLGERIPNLVSQPELEEAVLLARDVGVLLWYGYAWDDGAIDRVVNPADDPTEIMYLNTFLEPPAGELWAPRSLF